MLKNSAGQKLRVYVFDSTTNLPKTGDAANLTAYVNKDYAGLTVLGDTSATEEDATNGKGFYLFDLTQSETNADILAFACKSTTANMVCLPMPATVFTRPPLFTSLVIDSTGRVNAFLIGVLTSVFTEGAAGRIAAAFKQFFNIAAPTATMDHGILVDTVTTATTATNLTNAPTVGDFTAAMKASVNSEADTAIADAALATASNLAVVAGYIDTEVAAIKAKTDNLPASPAAVGSAMTLTAAYDAAKTAATQVSVDDLPTNAELATSQAAADDATLAAIPSASTIAAAVHTHLQTGTPVLANVKAVNDVDLQGDGTTGDKWRPA